MKTQEFTITDEHLKLIRNFNVGWQDCETGAPEIDPKRPYGNSDVMYDIHEILTGERIGSKRDELTGHETEKYEKLHKETQIVLQIVLATGQFKSGKYKSYGFRKWTECAD